MARSPPNGLGWCYWVRDGIKLTSFAADGSFISTCDANSMGYLHRGKNTLEVIQSYSLLIAGLRASSVGPVSAVPDWVWKTQQ